MPWALDGASDARNLWPERTVGNSLQFDPPQQWRQQHHDGVESRSSRAVCAGKVALTPAQQAVVANCYNADPVL